MTTDYWRALAEARQRELDDLRARLLAAIDTIPDEHVRAFVAALDVARPSWIRDLDIMTTAVHLEPSEVVDVLDDLWRRVEADNSR
ncbi:MAG TPA: hypothetical protein VHT23_08375 [Gemmatimonadaceae bacterium]|nr:hypothetical protein [Gemmatimonadaceae bacterium]